MSAREGSAAAPSHPGCIEPGAAAPAAGTRERASGSAERALPRIPGIVITARLGEGLRGTVYAGFQRGGRVAVKVLRKGASLDRPVLERLMRRASSEGSQEAEPLVHPALLPVLEIGISEAGSLFYTMPLLRGDSLECLIDDLKRGSSERPSLNPFSVGPGGETHPQLARRAADVLAESAAGLGEAHSSGVIHRRLSPRNMIFTPAGRLVITDFGGAPSVGSLEGLARVAPDEIVAEAGPPGPAADVYSFGAILYEVFTRRLPFEAATPQELRKAIVKGRFPVPRSLRSDVPAALEAIILKALALNPRDRYAHAGELADDLRRFLRHETPGALREARAQESRAADGPHPRMAATSPEPGSPLWSAARRIVARVPSQRWLAAVGVLSIVALLGWWAGREESGAPLSRLSLDPGPAAPSLSPSEPARQDTSFEARSVRMESVSESAASLPAPRAAPGRSSLGGPRAAGHALAFGVGEGLPEVSLDGPAFLALVDGLLDLTGDPDRRFLCGWSREILGLLDLAPRPASIALPPNIRLELDAPPGASFTGRWIRASAELDPAALLDRGILAAVLRDDLAGPAAPPLDPPEASTRREEIIRELLDAQARLLEPEAERSLSTIAREHWVTNGMDALRALAAAGAHDTLVDLARSRLPLEMRVAALFFLGADAALHRPELRELASTCPETPLRRIAFRHLSRDPGEDMLPEIESAMDDPALREEALSALAALPPSPAAARLAVELLRHRDETVRTRAVAILSADRGWAAAPDLSLVLLSPRRSEREAALEVVRASCVPGEIAAALDSLLLGRAPKAVGVLQSP